MSLSFILIFCFQPINMSDLDDLDTRSYSVAEFCETAQNLLESEDSASFVRFVLCGRYQNHQVVVDPIQNRLDPERKIKGLRDFDSLLGICEDIPVRSPLTLFPLAKKDDTLNTNIHLNYSFVIPGVSSIEYDPRKLLP